MEGALRKTGRWAVRQTSSVAERENAAAAAADVALSRRAFTKARLYVPSLAAIRQ